MTYQNDNILVCRVFVIFVNFKLFKSIQKKASKFDVKQKSWHSFTSIFNIITYQNNNLLLANSKFLCYIVVSEFLDSAILYLTTVCVVWLWWTIKLIKIIALWIKYSLLSNDYLHYRNIILK